MKRDSHAFRGGQRHQRMMDETNPQRQYLSSFCMGLSDGTETAIRQKKKGARADKRHRHPEFTILELREPKASGSSFFVKKRLPKMGVSII